MDFTSAFGSLEGCPIGIVPIHWRVAPQEVDSQLAELGGIGYEGVQFGDTYPQGEHLTLTAVLRQHELRLAEVYAPIDCTPDGPTATAYEAALDRLDLLTSSEGDVLVAAVGGSPDRDMSAGRADDGPRLTDKGWERLVDLVERLSRTTVARGGQFGFHPHAEPTSRHPPKSNGFSMRRHPRP